MVAGNSDWWMQQDAVLRAGCNFAAVVVHTLGVWVTVHAGAICLLGLDLKHVAELVVGNMLS